MKIISHVKEDMGSIIINNDTVYEIIASSVNMNNNSNNNSDEAK